MNPMTTTKLLGSLARTGLAALALALASQVARAEPPLPAERHSLSEICAGERCSWEKVVECTSFIEGLNFDERGRLWMVSVIGGQVLRVDNGRCVPVGASGGSPNGARFAPDGRLFMTDRKQGLMAVDPATGERTQLFAGHDGGAFRGLNDLVFDAKGGLYFTDPVGSDALSRIGRVYYVAPGEGSKPQVFADGLAYPNGVAVSADGQNVYVAEFAENRILSMPSRNSTDTFGLPYVFARLQGGIGPDGLAVDSAGNVYAMHYGAGEVTIYDKTGFAYGTIPLPREAGLGSTNLAFRDGYLYVSESLKNVVWRLPVRTQGLAAGKFPGTP
jgi:gluconolactonase